jgi:hypothetical protein
MNAFKTVVIVAAAVAHSVMYSTFALAAEPAKTPAKAKSTDRQTAMPKVDTSATAGNKAVSADSATASPAGKKTNDRLELGATVVTGNRELPKVLYIVPWKKADIGELPGQPFNTLLDEVLTPVDREVFKREVGYYGAVASGQPTPSADGSAPPASPK